MIAFERATEPGAPSSRSFIAQGGVSSEARTALVEQPQNSPTVPAPDSAAIQATKASANGATTVPANSLQRRTLSRITSAVAFQTKALGVSFQVASHA